MTFKVHSYYAGHENFGFVIEAPDQSSIRLRAEQWTRKVAAQARTWACENFGVRRQHIRFAHR